jgi:glutamyl/glutaminyl-tRNA synthetase
MVDEGVQVLSDIENMKEGLKDTVEAISEELDIKKTVLNKAIKVAFKNSQSKDKLSESRVELDDIEQILMAAGRA